MKNWDVQRLAWTCKLYLRNIGVILREKRVPSLLELTVKSYYKNEFKVDLDLRNPQDFNQKIQWFKLNEIDVRKVDYSDKLKVKDLVADYVATPKVLLNDVLSNLDSLNTLNPPYVIKANHDSGSVWIIKDNKQIDSKLVNEIKHANKNIFGYKTGEWPYVSIDRKVFVEEFIETDSDDIPDYKFHCNFGKVKFMHFIYDRGNDPKEILVDPNGEELGFDLYENMSLATGFKKPDEWEEMVAIAEKVSSPFAYCRVDLYLAKGTIYLGEVTFFPMGGGYHTDGQRKLGGYLCVK